MSSGDAARFSRSKPEGRSEGDSTAGPPRESDTGTAGAFRRWAIVILFVIASIYVLSRVLFVSQHPRPSLVLTKSLGVAFDREQLGLDPGAKLVEVNGVEVVDLDEARAAYERSDAGIMRLVFHQGTAIDDSTITQIWATRPAPFRFDISPEQTLLLEDNAAPSELGFEDGDVIIAINGVPIEGLTIPPTEVRAQSTEAMTYTRFTVQSGQSSRDIVVQRPYFSIREWARLTAGIGFGLIGIFVYWLRPGTRSAVGFLFFCLYCASFWLVRSIPFVHRFQVENAAYLTLQCFLPMAAGILLFTFTPLRLINLRVGIWLGSGIAIGVALLAGNAILSPRYAAHGILTTTGFRVWAGLMLALFVVSLPLNFWVRLGKVNLGPTDRIRTRVLSLSFLLAFFLPTVLAMSFTIVGFELANTMTYRLLSEVSILIFPFFIGYAVVRHNLLRLNELAREGLLFTLLMASVTILYVAVTAVVVPIAENFIPESETWFRPIAFAGVLAFVTPIHQRARHWTEKRFNRLPFEFETFLETLSRIEETANSPFDFAQDVVAEVAQLVKSKRVAFLSRFPGHDQWVLTAMVPLPVTGNTTDSCRSLLALLEQEKHELYRDEIVDNIEYQHLKREALEGFVSLDATAIFPLMARGQVIGALTIGEKSSGGNFSMPELRALRRVGQQVAGVLFNLMGKQITERSRRIVDIYPNFPEKIGAYAIQRVLGEGGMSYVYLGESRNRLYAIKVPNRMIQASVMLMERFQREASAIQQLKHPNIVSVREVGWMGPEPFMVLEYFENGSLDDEVRRNGPLTERAALYVVQDIAQGLKYAREHGIIHRDIKPKNLFRGGNGIVKIGDFGLAQLADMTSITVTGEFFGTADYLSPEVVEGEPATWLADQYALGITLYFLLTGNVPFKAATAQAAVYRRVNEPPPDPRDQRQEVSAEASRVVQRLMARQPDQRYPDYDELLRALESVIEPADPLSERQV